MKEKMAAVITSYGIGNGERQAYSVTHLNPAHVDCFLSEKVFNAMEWGAPINFTVIPPAMLEQKPAKKRAKKGKRK